MSSRFPSMQSARSRLKGPSSSQIYPRNRVEELPYTTICYHLVTKEQMPCCPDKHGCRRTKQPGGIPRSKICLQGKIPRSCSIDGRTKIPREDRNAGRRRNRWQTDGKTTQASQANGVLCQLWGSGSLHSLKTRWHCARCCSYTW